MSKHILQHILPTQNVCRELAQPGLLRLPHYILLPFNTTFHYNDLLTMHVMNKLSGVDV